MSLQQALEIPAFSLAVPPAISYLQRLGSPPAASSPPVPPQPAAHGSSWMQRLHENQRSHRVVLARYWVLPSCSSADSNLLFSNVTSPFALATVMHNFYSVYKSML